MSRDFAEARRLSQAGLIAIGDGVFIVPSPIWSKGKRRALRQIHEAALRSFSGPRVKGWTPLAWKLSKECLGRRVVVRLGAPRARGARARRVRATSSSHDPPREPRRGTDGLACGWRLAGSRP